AYGKLLDESATNYELIDWSDAAFAQNLSEVGCVQPTCKRVAPGNRFDDHRNSFNWSEFAFGLNLRTAVSRSLPTLRETE
ncbi:MAG: hypothetical protein OXN84_13550, partial [Albidovulum sp.]|nr:hypothetical protein [Albidovulum sp.]